MSYNSLVKITTINTALSIATRPFDVCLMVSKTKDIATADNLPISSGAIPLGTGKPLAKVLVSPPIEL